MRISDILMLAVKNIFNGGIKGLLSIISVCIAIASISLISGIGWGVAGQINDELSKINTNATIVQSLNSNFDDNTISLIKNTSGVKGAMPVVFEFGTLFAKTQSTETLVVGIDKDFHNIFDIKTIHGIELGVDEKEFKGNQVIVDNILAESIYYRTNIVGKKIQIGYGQNVEEYEIISVIESPKAGIEALIGKSLPAVVYIPYKKINEDYGQDKAAAVAITCNNSDDYNQVTGQLLRRLELNNSDGKYQLDNISKYADMAVEITDIVAVMISCVAGISVIVGGIGMMSSMISNIECRKSEIGTYMALGIYKKDIRKIYMCESLLTSACGGVLGVLLSIAGIYTIKHFEILNINANITAIIVCFISAILCGVLSGYLPAKRAAELDPIDAIRWE